MLEVAAKWNNSPFFPEIRFSKGIDYLEKITQHDDNHPVSQSPDFPVWKDELYLELHRGCYTTHADQKKYNRYCERLLYEAELWASFATLLCKDRFVSQPLFSNISTILEKEGFCQADWQELIAIAWKKVLFNQFHDILPGTSIPEVFIEANQDWESAIEIGENILHKALRAIASSIKFPQAPQPDAKPLVVFNSLNWKRSQLVTIEDSGTTVYDCTGKIVQESQFTIDNKLIFLAENIPSVGYSLFWLCPKNCFVLEEELEPQEYILSNQYLRVVINSENGNLDSIYDKKNYQEILSGQGNNLEFFEDQGQYWDAWNIDPEYEQKPLFDIKLKSITWLEYGQLRQKIRVVKQFNKSEFTQDYILEESSPILKISNQVNWQETNVMVKVAFPLNLNSDYVTYEIPCGTIKRSTQLQTAATKAKWEVSALNWADLTDHEKKYGVSLLNDCKYGYDVKPNQLRLTLLRSSLWPDPQSDQGIHHFTYAIYPHKNSWQTAKTVQKGYELNTPLRTIKLEQYKPNNQEDNQLLPRSELLNLTADNLILMALKLNNNQELIIRCYEAQGEVSSLKLASDLNLQLESLLDCLERNQKVKPKNIIIKPFKIVTLKFKIN
jgi:alpha-mannosidase